MKKIKAEMWELNVSDSVLDSVHGFGRSIKEFYIPENDIAFNIDGINKKVNVFKLERAGRYDKATKIEDIELSKPFVDMMEKYLEMKSNIFIEATKATME